MRTARLPPCRCCQVFAKFDTSEEKLEALSAELGVKALPVFKFYKVCRIDCRVVHPTCRASRPGGNCDNAIHNALQQQDPEAIKHLGSRSCPTLAVTSCS